MEESPLNKGHQKAVDFEIFFYSYHAQNLLYLSEVQVQLFDVGCLSVPSVCVSMYKSERRDSQRRRECVRLWLCL